MEQLIILLHVIVAVVLVVLIMMQQGKGAQVGASFGSGASQTLFGSQGSASFLMKITALFAALFLATSLGLGYLIAHENRQQDPLDALTAAAKPNVSKQQPVQNTAPAPVLPAAGVPMPTSGTAPSSTNNSGE